VTRGTPTPDPTDGLIGGRYRVVRELGRGGMGTVYEAENVRTHRRVALKTMRDGAADGDETRARFAREARAAGQLRHPNVVDVLDLGDDDGRGLRFIVQELLEGGDLGQCLRAVGPLAPRVALATLLPVMDALAAAHARGVFHRDVKPDNLFLHEGPFGVVPKVIDFGIAKLSLGEVDPSRSITGEMVGSPNYVSPEQCRGDRDIDGRADVWSMGMVFYKCLAGAVAYAAPTTSMLLAKIIYEEPAPLAALAPSLPRDLAAVIQRAVVKDRALRWSSMAEFAAAVRGCALWRGVDAARAQRWIVNARGETAERPPEPAADDPGDAPEVSWPEPEAADVEAVATAARPQRRGGWWAAIAAAALVAAGLWPRSPAVVAQAAPVAVATTVPEALLAAPVVTMAEPTAVAQAARVTPVRAAPARRARALTRRVQPAREQRRGFNGAPIID
jgi:serine/threonine-protein kinase